MRTKCFEIGAVQAFLDGETNAAETAAIAGHVAECEGCSALLTDSEEENAYVFSALEREMNTLVPTQRLWTRINESIETEHRHSSIWQRFLSAIKPIGSLDPSFAGAAVLLVVAGLAAFVWFGSSPADEPFASIKTPITTIEQPVRTDIQPVTVSNADGVRQPSGDIVADVRPAYVSETSNHRVRVIRADTRTRVADEPRNIAADTAAAEPLRYLPGEESYVKTIADLKQNVENDPGRPLSPSSRVAYERDMAVVNDAIDKMRTVVRKDPQNQGAKQILYASYQNKIDLLNSVAQRDELLASIR